MLVEMTLVSFGNNVYHLMRVEEQSMPMPMSVGSEDRGAIDADADVSRFLH